jgi:hypothetical protein
MLCNNKLSSTFVLSFFFLSFVSLVLLLANTCNGAKRPEGQTAIWSASVRVSYNNAARPMMAPTAAAGAAVRMGPAAPPVEPVVAPPVSWTLATWTPYAVPTLVLPETVVVYVEEEVVLAVQPAQVVQGAEVLQGPAVHPGQSVPGQPDCPHQFVHGPLVRHAELVLQ